MSGPTHTAVSLNSVWILHYMGAVKSIPETIGIMILGVFFGVLADADGEYATAHRMSFGWTRILTVFKKPWGLFVLVMVVFLVYAVSLYAMVGHKIELAYNSNPRLFAFGLGGGLCILGLVSWGVSWIFRKVVHHRGITHSWVPFVLIPLACLYFQVEQTTFFVIYACYASHVFLDLLTQQGCQLLWPLDVMFSFVTPRIAKWSTPALDLLLGAGGLYLAALGVMEYF